MQRQASGQAQTGRNRDHVIAGVDVTRREHLAREFAPTGTQSPLAHPRQQPVTRHRGAITLRTGQGVSRGWCVRQWHGSCHAFCCSEHSICFVRCLCAGTKKARIDKQKSGHTTSMYHSIRRIRPARSRTNVPRPDAGWCVGATSRELLVWVSVASGAISGLPGYTCCRRCTPVGCIHYGYPERERMRDRPRVLPAAAVAARNLDTVSVIGGAFHC